MAARFIISINNVNCSYGLVTYKINAYDLQDADSGDDQTGYTHYNLVRKDKFQIELAWEAIPCSYANQILNAIDGCSEIPVSFRYRGTTYNITAAYRGDRSYETLRFAEDEDDDIVNLSFNMIEQ